MSRSNGTSSRRYRRIGHGSNVDDSLFGKNTSKRTGKTIVSGEDSIASLNSNQHQHHLPQQPHRDSTRVGPNSLRAGHGHNKHDPPVADPAPHQIVDVDELDRIQHESKILTSSELEEQQAQADAIQEEQRLSAKARKEHMMKLAAEAALRAPKSAMEQIFEAENKETLRRAAILKDQAHDSVKLLKTLGARAAAFTIRDQQLLVHKELAKDTQLYEEKMNTLMEIDRLEGLQKQEEIDLIKKQKRIHDRQILEQQIQERKQLQLLQQQQKMAEAQEMLQEIAKQQQVEQQKEHDKLQRTKLAFEEIQKVNRETQELKKQKLQMIKQQEAEILLYQQKKDQESQQREQEEMRKKKEAEIRCAKLRSQQEKAANAKAELDELRAKRAAEARERQAREAELALAHKQLHESQLLAKARHEQSLNRQQAKIQEAQLQQKEYESIMKQVQQDKDLVVQQHKANHQNQKLLREQILHQIEAKKQLQAQQLAQKRQEGELLKQEYEKELSKLEQIRLEEVQALEQAGVNPMYLAEMKALDLAKMRK